MRTVKAGLEPATKALTVLCSSIELLYIFYLRLPAEVPGRCLYHNTFTYEDSLTLHSVCEDGNGGDRTHDSNALLAGRFFLWTTLPWRKLKDSNPHNISADNGFQDRSNNHSGKLPRLRSRESNPEPRLMRPMWYLFTTARLRGTFYHVFSLISRKIFDIFSRALSMVT